MMRSLLLGTLLGGLMALAWSFLSWEVIGWHEMTMTSFQNEDEVSAAIASRTESLRLLVDFFGLRSLKRPGGIPSQHGTTCKTTPPL